VKITGTNFRRMAISCAALATLGFASATHHSMAANHPLVGRVALPRTMTALGSTDVTPGSLSLSSEVLVSFSGGGSGNGMYVDSSGAFPTATVTFPNSSTENNSQIDMWITPISAPLPQLTLTSDAASIGSALWDFANVDNGGVALSPSSLSGAVRNASASIGAGPPSETIQWPLTSSSGSQVPFGSYHVFVSVVTNGALYSTAEATFEIQ